MINDLITSESYAYESDTGTICFDSPLDRSLGPDTPDIRSVVNRLDGHPRLPCELSRREISQIESQYNVDLSSIAGGRLLLFPRHAETRLAHSTPRRGFSATLPQSELPSPIDRGRVGESRAAGRLPLATGGMKVASPEAAPSENPLNDGNVLRARHGQMPGVEHNKDGNRHGEAHRIPANGITEKAARDHRCLNGDQCDFESHSQSKSAHNHSPGKYNAREKHKESDTGVTHETHYRSHKVDARSTSNDSNKENHQHIHANSKGSRHSAMNRGSLVTGDNNATSKPRISTTGTLLSAPDIHRYENWPGQITSASSNHETPIPTGTKESGPITDGENLDRADARNEQSPPETRSMHDEMQRLRRENSILRTHISALEAEIGDRSQMMDYDETSEWADAYLQMRLESLDSWTRVDALNTLKKILISLNIGSADNIPATMKLWGRLIFHTSRFLDKLHRKIHPFECMNPSEYTVNPEAPENLARFVQCLENMLCDLHCCRGVQDEMPPLPADNKI